MFLDARTLPDDTALDADVCVIGAGPAGITLAREFANQKFSVCILESGGLEIDAATQALQKLDNIGREYPRIQRMRPRYFGGASNFWGGHIVPLRDVNFEKHDWMPHSGWPFGLNELLSYYDRAASMIKLAGYSHYFSGDDLARAIGNQNFPFNPKMVETVMSRYLTSSWNRAPSIGEVLFDEVKDLPNVRFYTHANVTSLRCAANGNHVTQVSARTLQGNKFTVKARRFVLAAGGIENARMLLLSDDLHTNGIGNQHDVVGRYFMEHISFASGAIVPNDKKTVLSHYGKVVDYGGGRYARAHLAIPQEMIRHHKIPDFRAEIMVMDSVDPGISTRFVNILRDLLLDSPLVYYKFAHHFRPIIHWDEFYGRHNKDDKGPAVYRLANYVEQTPNPHSRVTLSDKRDKLGMRKAALDWQLSPLDRKGILIAHQLIASEVARTGFGQMVNQFPKHEDEILAGARGGAHHIGTTRMHENPKNGVVDANCRVHGMENLYVAGSSVFPTGGYANPTFTILALTLRLADHLKSVIAR